MLTVERLALELLNYKITELTSKGQPKNGAASDKGHDLWQLHDHLRRHLKLLNDEERRIFSQLSETLKRHSKGSQSNQDNKAAVHSLDQLDFGALLEAEDQSAANMPVASPEAAADSSSNDFDLGLDALFDEEKPAPSSNSATEVLKLAQQELSEVEREELATLKRLAERVWWEDVKRSFRHLATTYRAETERHTVRIMYAMLRNLEQHSKSPNFSSDTALENFKVYESVPDYVDPLVSLNDIEAITGMVTDIAEHILHFKNPKYPLHMLALPEHAALDYLRRFGLEVAKDPYAGKLTLNNNAGPNSGQIRVALQELNREAMREEMKAQQRHRLEERLKLALENEKNQQRFFQKDVQSYTRAVEDLMDALASHLPKRVGGRGHVPQLSHGVLFAENPALRLEAVPDNALQLTLRLKASLRFQLAGMDVALAGSGKTWNLFVEHDEIRLEPMMQLHLRQGDLLIVQEEGYMHARFEAKRRALSALVAEVVAIHFVLHSQERPYPQLLEMATGIAVGQTSESLRQVFSRLQTMVRKTPDPKRALAGFLQGSAKALQLNIPKDQLIALHRVLCPVIAEEMPSLDSILADSKHVLATLDKEPLRLKLEGQLFSVRTYSSSSSDMYGDVVVMAPGRPLGSFSEYMMTPFGEGTMLCARSGKEFVALYLNVPMQRANASQA